jgi:hypothetical protein
MSPGPAITRLVLAALLLAWRATPAGATAYESKTLSRIHDPVVVTADRLGALGKRDTAQLRLYRIEDGRLVAIPFQFDARDAEGELEVDAPVDFRLDANDELTFMAKDAGDRAAEDPFPEGCDGAVEIEIADPHGAGKAWAYLAGFSAPPPREAVEPYVVFDLPTRQARSNAYTVDYAADRNFFTGLRLPRLPGAPEVNLLRQSRMRGSPTFSLLLTDFTLDFTEQNAIVEIDGVRSGPVRAVRRARLSVDLGPMFPELPNGTAYTYHYATSYQTPTDISFPWLMLKALREFRFENVLDFNPAALPVHYFDQSRPEGVLLAADGTADVRTTEDHDWWAHSADGRAMLHAFVIPQEWREWGIVRGTVVRSGGIARANDAGSDGDGTSASVVGASPSYAAGYTLLNMTNLREAGEYRLMQASIALPRAYQAGDEVDAMAMLRAPLTVTIRPMR